MMRTRSQWLRAPLTSASSQSSGQVKRTVPLKGGLPPPAGARNVKAAGGMAPSDVSQPRSAQPCAPRYSQASATAVPTPAVPRTKFRQARARGRAKTSLLAR